MPQISIGGVVLNAPPEYSVKMAVFTAPMKAPQKGAGPKMFVQQERQYLRNLVVAREDVPEGITAAQYADFQTQLMSQQMPGFQKLKTGTVKIGGVESPLVESQGPGPEGMLVQTMTTYYLHERVMFTISASNMAGLPYQDTRAEYLKIMESFQILPD